MFAPAVLLLTNENDHAIIEVTIIEDSKIIQSF